MKAISIKNLKKEYPNGFQALKSIDLEVEEGDFFALLGPNGAGKSTTIGIITSLVNKTKGKVKIFDNDIDKDFSKAKKYVGIVPQEFNCNIFETVEQVLIHQAGYYGIPKKESIPNVEYYLKQLELWEKRKDQVKNLSGGMKRRLMIARALVHNPKLLILDEPTAGVDIEIRRSMWDFITKLNKEEGMTIILTTHYLEEAEQLCNNVAIINDGSIIENTTVKKLLKQLNKETIILELENSIEELPQIKGYNFNQKDEQTLEVEHTKKESLTHLIGVLKDKGIVVNSARPKSNRLEELFLEITGGDKK